MVREQLANLVGKFGLMFGGFMLITGGGALVVYGGLTFYLGVPGGNDLSALEPLHRVVAPMVESWLTYVVVAVGAAGFVFEIKRNGLQISDDRLLVEREREWRREKAQESDVWRPPEEDREGKSVYEKLREEQAESGLVLWSDELVGEKPPRIRGEVRNTTRAEYTDVQMAVQFIDETGDVVDTGGATRKELSPGDAWQFEVFGRDAGDAVTYRISRPTGNRDRT